MSNEDVEKLLFDTQRIYSESNKIKDKIIIMLIVLMFFEAVAGFAGFVWYESQFETVQTTEELKEINRMCEQLNGTGYDVITIHSVQDKYHNKYKNKYNDTYTDKWKKKEVKNKTQNK